MVRRRIPHRLLPEVAVTECAALGVELQLAGRPTGFFAVYAPPKNRYNSADIRALLTAAHPCVMAGDWNAKHPAWNSRVENPRGRRLLHDAETLDFSVSGPDMPTHYPDQANHREDTLDIVVHQGLTCQMTQDVIVDEFLSDHLPVVVTLLDAAPKMAPRTPPRRRCIDWRVFEWALDDAPQPRPPDTPASINESATSFTVLLQSALAAATTERPLPTTYTQLPPRLLALIRRKRALRRRWQLTRCPRMRAELRAVAERVKTALNDHATESWERGLDEASTDWVRLHLLCRRLNCAADPIRPLRHPDGTLRYDAEGRAELFADHLQRQFSPNPAEDPARALEVETAVAEQLGAPPPADEEVLFFSPSAVKKHAARLKLRKAPGPDGITNAALRHLPHRAVVTLMRLYNAILRTAHFPDPWKEAQVIMLPKKGKSVFDPASYRPISLLATQSKLFEAMLLPTIRRHFTPRPEQFGFRSEHSTTLQLSRVLHDITAALNKKEVAAAIFLDMEKAFDRVWHAGLVCRLLDSDIPRRVVAIIRSFLLNRRFHVSVEGAKSSCRPIAAGHLRDLVPLQAQHKDRPVVERGANRYPPQALGRNGAPVATRGCKRGRKQRKHNTQPVKLQEQVSM
ncbi:unnamed protein product [Pieris brassicae]|uniref:Reverse transcriptase domain-containing protein n=1 Tax=Pieris brassicae TaxID=7116 RepID=A0A9P0TI59_PIEBR|nr:unnamed protein product [Pieris brassicae]